MLRKRFILLCIGGLSVVNMVPSLAQEPGIRLDGSHRLRYQSLNDGFKPGAEKGAQLMESRLLARLSASGENLFAALEIADSRAWLDDETVAGTGEVNTLEPLQLYAGWREQFGDSTLAVKAGRMTIDVGSRRLLARIVFRNTLNAFTGVHADWKLSGQRWQVFHTAPVQILPGAGKDLHDIKLDQGFDSTRFSGIHGTFDGRGSGGAAAVPGAQDSQPWISSLSKELYLFRLDERDTRNLATRNRVINTFGMRVLRAPKPRQLDFELELNYQTGSSHSTASPADTTRLDHQAYGGHAQIGYQFADRFQSRLVLQADYASGDRNPGDSGNNRFDPLYGVRRFEFGPTGLYGTFARSNIASGDLRWEMRTGRYSGFIAYRAAWLASETDAQSPSGLRDPSGATDDFIGQHIEARLRIQWLPASTLELGGAYLRKGDFLRNAAGAPGGHSVPYWYSMISYAF